MVECAHLPSKEKYNFKNYEYLEAIVKHPWKPGDQRYLEKSAQSGVSELAIDWSLWLMERNLKNFRGIGYCFPAMKQLQDHIKARVIPILEINRFHRNLKNVNLGFIRYNNVPWYFRSGNSRALKSWPADAVVIDEFDEYKDSTEIIPTIEARMNASSYKWIFGMSTPTHPDTGIDKAISLCSQYNWYIHCEKCGKEFSPLNEIKISTFENCVVRDSYGAGFVCPNCSDLTQTNGIPGRWIMDVQKQTQKTSYCISRIFLANASLEELLYKYEEALNIQQFYNSDLGLPYSPPNSRLRRKDISDCALGEVDITALSSKSTWAGIDVGKICYYAIGCGNENGQINVISYGECKFEEIQGILSKFSVKYLVVDLRPYEQEVKRIIRGNRGYFAADFNAGNQEDWYRIIKVDEETPFQTVRVIKCDRTQSCDQLIEQIIAKKKYIFPVKVKNDNNFLNQMCSVMRIDKTSKDTNEIKAIYKSTTKKDHYFFAMVYLNLAFNLKKANIARVGGLFF
jgi:hypothetical protein